MYRQIKKQIEQALSGPNPRIVLILGLRQTGKTTLAKTICQGKKFQMFNFDLPSDQYEFLQNNRHSLKNFADRYQDHLIFIDEIQKLPEATVIIKHLFDHYKIQFILTGSSELKIKKDIGDSLAGRTEIFHLYPLSLSEILIQENKIGSQEKVSFDQAQPLLEKYLVYGSLPSLQNVPVEKYHIFLKDFVDLLLSKDVLEISGIKKSNKIYSLARFLSMQIGQLVNVNELSSLLEISRPSIYNYLDILEQLSIICRAYPLSTNERQAISEKFKVYFTDLGIRNLLLNNFSNFQTRLDKGMLLENAAYLGIKRQQDYQRNIYKLGFFRSKTGSEIDVVLQKNNKELLYEVKVSPKYAQKNDVQYITLQNVYQYLT